LIELDANQTFVGINATVVPIEIDVRGPGASICGIAVPVAGTK